MRRGKSRMVIPIVAISIIAAILILSSTLMPQVQAGDGPKVVRGIVYDQLMNPLQSANVTINMVRPDTTIRSTLWYDMTDSDGSYSVTFMDFGGSPWEIGDTIEVFATFGADIEFNSTIATSSAVQPIQYVNVTIATIIPEFGAFSSVSLAGMSMIMIAVFLIARRRKLD